MERTNQTKRALTPKLRFPEFKDGPGWELRALSSALDYERPENYTVASTAYQPSGTPVLTANKSFVLGYTNETDGIFYDLPVIIFDDFTTDRKYVDFPFKVKSSAIKILKRKSDDDLKLIFELMGGIRFDPTEHKRHYISEYQHRDIPLPGEAEQRKIAACLTSVDELLSAEERKLEALQAHKNGLMQQFFPYQGESSPRLRFPAFRGTGEWKTDRFDKLYAFQRNNALSRDKLNYERGTVKNIHYGDIHTKYPAHFDITKERVPFINEMEPVPPFHAEDYCTEGDLIFADASEDTNDVGKCMEVVNLNGERLLAGQHTILARRIDDRLIVGFSGYLFRSKRIRAQIEREAQGTKVYGISGTRLANVEVAFPNEPAEQQGIAACLGSLDALIAAASQKLDGLRTHKKGLLQQIFPSSEEDE